MRDDGDAIFYSLLSSVVPCQLEVGLLGSLMAALGPSTLLVGLVGVQQVPGQTGANS